MMKTMKTSAFMIALVLFATTAAAQSRPAPWVQHFRQARNFAEKDDKLILAYFNGSDWDPWTEKLDKDVITTKVFIDFASKHFILFDVDLPSENKNVARTIRQQNERLKEDYNITEVPTFVVMDQDGRELQRFGYEEVSLKKGEQKGIPQKAMIFLRGIVDAGTEAEAITKHDSLPDAIAFAEDHKLPLMLMVNTSDESQTMDEIKAILTNQDFVRFINTNTAFHWMAWPAEDDPSEDAKTFRAFVAKHRLPENPRLQMVLWDVTRDEVAARMPRPDANRPDLMVPKFQRSLPPIPYSGEWLKDIRLARAIAAQSDRVLFISFTRYETSEWCKKMRDEIYDTDDFIFYAKRNLVLCECDYSYFPPLDDKAAIAKLDVKKQEKVKLLDTYRVRGFPYVLLFNGKGQRLGNAKYMKGGTGPFLTEVENVRKSEANRDFLP